MESNTSALEPLPVKERDIKSTVVIGLTYSLLLNGFLYLGQLLIARTLTRHEYATFLVATNFVALCALIADLGLTPLLVRLFTEANHHSQKEKRNEVGQLLGTMLFVRGMMSLVVVAIVVFMAPQLGYSAQTIDAMAIFLASLVISSRLLVVRSVGEAYLRGKGQYRQYIAYSTLDAVCFALAIFSVRYYANDLMTMIVIYTFCNVPGFLLLARRIYLYSKAERVKWKIDPKILKKIFSQGMPLILGSIFLTIHNTADPLLLDKLSTPFEVSAFGAAVRIQSALLFLPAVFALVMAPEVTKLLVRNEHARARQLVTRSLTVLMVISCGSALVISAIPTFIMTTIFGGAKYLDATGLMLLLTWTFVGTSFAYFFIEMGIAEGNQWLTTMYMLIIMVISVLFDLVLIPGYGSRGTGIARLVAVGCGVIVLWIRRRSLRILDHAALSHNALLLIGVVAGCYAVVFTLKEIGANELITGLSVSILFFYLIHKSSLLHYGEVRQVLDKFRISLLRRRR